jgi:hypothetical protein
MKPSFASLACVAAALALAAACGSGSHQTAFDQNGPGTDGGTGSPDGTGMTASDGNNPILNTDGSGYDTCSGTHCSSDLRSLVDCSGNVVMSCPANEGCANGGCVAPCDAAAANKSTIGCDYFAVEPDAYTTGQGGCFAAYVVNTWDQPVTITADYNGMSVDVPSIAYVPSGAGQSITYTALSGGQLQPGQVAILFLNNDTSETVIGKLSGLDMNCPTGINVALATDAAQHGTGIGHAFHIATSAPVAAYDI